MITCGSGLASVEFDDCLFLEEGGEVFALGHGNDLARHICDVHVNVGRNSGAFVVARAGDALATVSVANGNHIPDLQGVACDVDDLAIYRNVAVADHLAGLEDGLRVAQTPNRGGKSKFEQTEEVDSRITVHSLSFLKRAVELLLEHVVITADDLLLQKLVAVFARALVAVQQAMLAVRVLALGGGALCLSPDVEADFAADVVLATSVCSHSFLFGVLVLVWPPARRPMYLGQCRIR